MNRYEEIKANRKSIIINNFIGGIAWAVGSTLGITIMLALIGFVVGKINLIPVIGNWASEVTQIVIQKNPELEK